MNKLLLCLMVLMMCGCVKQRMPTVLTSDEIAETMTYMNYFKDVHGICYAMIKSTTYSGYEVVAITTIPCEKVGL